MDSWVAQWRLRTLSWNYFSLEVVLAISLAVLIIASPAAAAMRLQDRSLYVNSSAAGATTFYRVSFRYMSPDPVGSVEMLFCDDPIPYHACVTPAGMDVSGATLGQQSGETGFSIGAKSTNRIVLTRGSVAPTDAKSVYSFDNIINPTSTGQAFAIRLKTHASLDASGPQIDFGSMRSQATTPIEIATQVPPMLIFCLAEKVEDNCVGTNDIHYNDMGEIRSDGTLTAQSQMAIGTNASGGFAIVANAAPMSAGTNVIDSPSKPTASRKGTNQFGINLVANTDPAVGDYPEGAWTNAVVSPDYGQTNRYKLESGDVVAYSPSVSLMKKYTVSYILNTSPSLRAGVYTTTINFVASGRF